MIVFDVNSRDKIEIPTAYKEELKKYRTQARFIRVAIAPVFEVRTQQQNAFFHAKLNEIARMTGYDRDELKQEVKMLAMELGYPPATDAVGDLVVEEDSGMLIPKPTSQATIEEMKIAIEALYIWCSDKGLDISSLGGYNG